MMRHASRFLLVLVVMLSAAVLTAAAGQDDPAPFDEDVKAMEVEPVEELPEAAEEPAAETQEPPLGELRAPASGEPVEPAFTEEEATKESPAEELPGPLEVPAPIVTIEVVGNEQVPTEDVLAAIKSEEGGQFSEDQVARDRQAVLSLGWFQTVSVERESVENGIRLVFRVRENPVVSEIVFEGRRELTREQLLGVMKTQPGQVYNAPQLARDAQTVEELYRSQG